MADVKISNLTNYDPLKDGMLIPVSYRATEGGNWKSGRISSDRMHEYLSDQILGKLKGVNGEITISKKEGTDEWIIKHELDTTLYVILGTGEVDADGTPNIANPSNNKIYLVTSSNEDETESMYTEWHWDGSKWAMFGKYKAHADLSGYYTAAEVDELLKDITGSDADGDSLAGISSKLNNLVGVVGDDTKGLVKGLADANSKISTLETDSATHATKTELKTTDDKAVANADAISALQTKVGERVEGSESTGILGEIDKLKADHATDKSALESSIETINTSLGTKAAKSTVDTLSTTVADHTTSIDALVAEKEGFATKTGVTEACGAVEAKLSDYAKIEALDGYATTVALAAKADETTVTALSTKVTTLENLPHLSSSEVDTAIVTKLAGYATENYVDSAIEDADISGKLGDYLKSADAASTYATKKSVTDITEVDGTIDTKVAAAKSDLQGKLDEANEKIEALETQMTNLLAKIAEYDKRFGYPGVTGETSLTWTKSFLLLEDNTPAEA